jgi:hypothetical protein
LGSLAALLALTAALGAPDAEAGCFCGQCGDDDPTFAEPSEEVIALLKEAGCFRELPGPFPGTVAAVVAIPRHLGESFADQIHAAIKDGNATTLRVLLVTADMLPG